MGSPIGLFSRRWPVQRRMTMLGQRHSVLFLVALLATAVCSTTTLAGDEDRENGPVVRTVEGPVRGFVETEPSTGRRVYEFLGIPYAAPPVGNLRWMPPQPVRHWGDPLDATR